MISLNSVFGRALTLWFLLHRFALCLFEKESISWQEKEVLALFRQLKKNPGSKPLARANLDPDFKSLGIYDDNTSKGLEDAVNNGRLKLEANGYVLTDEGYKHSR